MESVKDSIVIGRDTLGLGITTAMFIGAAVATCLFAGLAAGLWMIAAAGLSALTLAISIQDGREPRASMPPIEG